MRTRASTRDGGVPAPDPLVLGAVALVLLFLAVGAAFTPAWRASRLDPATILRQE